MKVVLTDTAKADLRDIECQDLQRVMAAARILIIAGVLQHHPRVGVVRRLSVPRYPYCF